MPDEARVQPQDPEDAGVQKKSPPAMQVEGASLLANDAKEHLIGRGFTDEQIDKWAQTYVSEHGSGDVAAFIAWIDAQQSS